MFPFCTVKIQSRLASYLLVLSLVASSSSASAGGLRQLPHALRVYYLDYMLVLLAGQLPINKVRTILGYFSQEANNPEFVEDPETQVFENLFEEYQLDLNHQHILDPEAPFVVVTNNNVHFSITREQLAILRNLSPAIAQSIDTDSAHSPNIKLNISSALLNLLLKLTTDENLNFDNVLSQYNPSVLEQLSSQAFEWKCTHLVNKIQNFLESRRIRTRRTSVPRLPLVLNLDRPQPSLEEISERRILRRTSTTSSVPTTTPLVSTTTTTSTTSTIYSSTPNLHITTTESSSTTSPRDSELRLRSASIPSSQEFKTPKGRTSSPRHGNRRSAIKRESKGDNLPVHSVETLDSQGNSERKLKKSPRILVEADSDGEDKLVSEQTESKSPRTHRSSGAREKSKKKNTKSVLQNLVTLSSAPEIGPEFALLICHYYPYVAKEDDFAKFLINLDTTEEVNKLFAQNILKCFANDGFPNGYPSDFMIEALKLLISGSEDTLGQMVLAQLEEAKKQEEMQGVHDFLISQIDLSILNWKAFSDYEIAMSLTQSEAHRFRRIRPIEILSSQGISSIANAFKHTTLWVQHELENEKKDKAKLVKRFIKIALKLVELGNFHSAFAIYCSLSETNSFLLLGHAPTRGKKTKSEKLQHLLHLFSTDGKFGAYRKKLELLRTGGQPCLAIFQFYLNEISTTKEVISDADEEIKALKIAKLLRQFSLYQALTPKAETVSQDLLAFFSKFERDLDEEGTGGI